VAAALLQQPASGASGAYDGGVLELATASGATGAKVQLSARGDLSAGSPSA
jgi:hypothetical protein